MPDADYKECKYDGTANVVKQPPKLRLNQGDKECRKEERNCREDCSLTFPVLLTIMFQNFVYNTIPLCLHCQVASATSMRVLGMQNRIAAVTARIQLAIVIAALLRIAKYVISLREKGKFARGTLRVAIDVRMP